MSNGQAQGTPALHLQSGHWDNGINLTYDPLGSFLSLP